MNPTTFVLLIALGVFVTCSYGMQPSRNVLNRLRRSQDPQDPAANIRLNSMREIAGTLLKTFRFPKGLSRLMFNGTETTKLLDLMYKLRKLRENGTDEYACINRCIYITIPNKDNDDCSEAQNRLRCAETCEQDDKGFANYFLSFSRSIVKLSCENERFNDIVQKEAMRCLTRIFVDTPKLVKAAKHPMDCYLELEDANTDEAACNSLKQCGVKQTFAMLREMCNQEVSEETFALYELLLVYGLTYASDGRLVNTCPALYSRN